MKAQKLGILSGIIAATCCLGPPLLILLGLGSLGFGSIFGKYHWYFILAGAILLGFAWRSYLKEKNRCATVGCKMTGSGTTLPTLITATFVVVLFFGLNLHTYVRGQNTTFHVTKAEEKQITIPVEGMSCFTCELTVQKALGDLKGVISSKASAQKGNVAILYNPNQVSLKDMITAINKTGYKALLPKE